MHSRRLARTRKEKRAGKRTVRQLHHIQKLVKSPLQLRPLTTRINSNFILRAYRRNSTCLRNTLFATIAPDRRKTRKQNSKSSCCDKHLRTNIYFLRKHPFRIFFYFARKVCGQKISLEQRAVTGENKGHPHRRREIRLRCSIRSVNSAYPDEQSV